MLAHLEYIHSNLPATLQISETRPILPEEKTRLQQRENVLFILDNFMASVSAQDEVLAKKNPSTSPTVQINDWRLNTAA